MKGARKPGKITTASRRKVRDLPARKPEARTERAVKGGAFVRIGDIKGESTDDRHKDWISLS